MKFTFRVSKSPLPKTNAHVRVVKQSWQLGTIEGEVSAGQFVWNFQWSFRGGKLAIAPSRGRALIQEPLKRFLEKFDYQLEAGGDYFFTIRAQL
ncbi:MAG: DUF3146 family protein [Oscillatoria sp. SIO1A7]|nr:DUF3146 family protein [Oscillatoria sp. SIO1A7]